VGAWPYCAVVDPAGKRLYVTNQEDETISVIDLDRNMEISKIESGETPEGIDITADGKKLLVANWGEGSISVIETHSLRVVSVVKTGAGSRAFGRFIVNTER